MKKLLRQASYLILLTLPTLFPGKIFAIAPEISQDYTLVSKQRISRTVFEYTFNVTLINHDEAIQNVSATVTSSSPHTTIMGNGRVQFNDADANATLVGNNTVVFRQDRLYPFNPEDLHWTIHYDPATPTVGEVDGVIDGWANFSTNELRVFKKDAFGSFYRFSTKGEAKQPFTLRLSRSVEPSSGLSFSKDVNGLEFQTNQNNHIHERTDELIIAEQPGEYVVTTTATVVESEQSFTATAKVKVYGEDELQLLVIVGIPERKIPLNTSLPVEMNIDLSGYDEKLVTEVVLEQLETGETRTLEANQTDRWGADYQVFIPLDTTQAGCFSYVVTAFTSKGNAASSPEKVCVTQFPIQYKQPVAEHLWTSPDTGASIANNYILITVAEGTSEERVKQIAQVINGQVVGQGFYDPTYQIELLGQPTADSSDVFNNLLKYYSDLLKTLGFTEVESIELYTRTGFTMSISDDPFYVQGDQRYLDLIRANEAWYVGGMEIAPTIAIVDTGVDFDHPDIRTKLFTGTTFFPESTSTDDSHSHGTHVAGIAAAITNNGTGIASVSRNSAILPVRVSPERPVFYQDMANGIKWAAFKKAKIINVSMGVPENLTEKEIRTCIEQFGDRGENVCVEEKAAAALCGAVEYASEQGSLVVVAAGNDGAYSQPS